MSIIAERNRDVEHIVNAATNLGHYKHGQQFQKHFAMLVMSDVHRSYEQMTNMVDYLNEKEGIDVGLSLGDHMGDTFRENDARWYLDNVLRSEKRIFTVIGNHDVGNNTRADKSGTCREVFEKYLLPLREKMGLPTLNETYYAVAFDEYKITLIVLDNYRTPDERDENGDFTYNRGLSCLDQGELDWLVETLNTIGVSILPRFAAIVISTITMQSADSIPAIVIMRNASGTNVISATSLVINILLTKHKNTSTIAIPRSERNFFSRFSPMRWKSPISFKPSITAIRQNNIRIV